MASKNRFKRTKRFKRRWAKIWSGAATLTTHGVPAPPLSYEKALAVFDQLAAREDLAFGYAQEACFARTHEMCEAALSMGFMPQKAWAVDREGTGSMAFNLPNGDRIHYWAHVAMVLPVKTPGGEIHDLIFCPALFDGPVPLQEWGKTINALPHDMEIKRLGRPPTDYLGDYDPDLKTTRALSDPLHERHPLQIIKFYQPMEKAPRIVFASQYCRDFLFPALGQWPERQGNGWVSADPRPKPPPRPGKPTLSALPPDTPKAGG
jgi:hypothetical protein